ncbi:MAG: group II truncated hemoglobin [Bdellovibrio sp.]|nr:group II truncated hemoglobin [Methylotenera sp.]
MLNKIEDAGSNQSTFFQLLGGENGGTEKIRDLVETFYDIMDADPKAAPIRALHPADLTSSREKLFMFLTGWTGGPQLYIERYGHPKLRQRHMHVAIGEAERDQWMFCMIGAMHQLKLEDKLVQKLAAQLHAVADFMRNQNYT